MSPWLPRWLRPTAGTSQSRSRSGRLEVEELESRLTPSINLPLTTVLTLLIHGTADELIPLSRRRGVVKCVVVNQSKEPVEVQTEYDGKTHRLMGGRKGHLFEVTLYPGKPAKDGAKSVAVKPGRNRCCSSYRWTSWCIRASRATRDRAWRWDWITRPESPISPVHRYRATGYLESATFWAVVDVGGKKQTTEKVGLKVKASDPDGK